MDTEATSAEAPGATPGAAPASVRLADRFEIRPGAALPELSSPLAPAFAAADCRGTGRGAFALAAPRHLALREETLISVRRLERAYVLRPLDWGVVDWPAPDGGRMQQPVIIVERPGGGRVTSSAAGPSAPMAEEAVIRRVLRPLANALRDLSGAGVAHRGIRPDNLFWREGGASEVVLGEAWSSPPGFAQPVLYETVPHGMADPAGRGWGRTTDDLYSLGATIAVLLNGGNPVDLDDAALVAAKITQGSFAVLAGSLRLSAPMAEVLRGLLSDNPRDRWTLDDLELWFDGRRLSPKAPSLPVQAARPVTFDGTDYWSCPALAHGLAMRWRQATAFLPEAGIGNWLKRSLGDEKRGAQADAIAADGGDGRTGPDRQLARMLMILDPGAPLRYRDLSAQVEALGGVLAHSFDRSETVQQFAQVVAHRLGHVWVDAQEETRPEHVLVRKAADMMAFFLGRTNAGFGIERCLYEANPGMPCRSPHFEREYVAGLGDLLPALNRVAQHADASTELIDRHVAAFIGARLGSGGDAELNRFGAGETPSDRCIGLLRLLATVQARVGVTELPALGGWVALQLKPLVDSFHHQPFREALAKEIGPLCSRNDFAAIVRLVENDDLRRRDMSGFEAARKTYARLAAEAHWIRGGGMTESARVLELARRAAAVAAGTVAVVACAATVVFTAI